MFIVSSTSWPDVKSGPPAGIKADMVDINRSLDLDLSFFLSPPLSLPLMAYHECWRARVRLPSGAVDFSLRIILLTKVWTGCRMAFSAVRTPVLIIIITTIIIIITIIVVLVIITIIAIAVTMIVIIKT